MKILFVIVSILLFSVASAAPNSWYIDLRHGFYLSSSFDNSMKTSSTDTDWGPIKKKVIFGYGVNFSIFPQQLIGISDNWFTCGITSNRSSDMSYTSRLTAIDYSYFLSGSIGDGLYLRGKVGRGAVELDGESSYRDYGVGASIASGITFVTGAKSDSWIYLEYSFTKPLIDKNYSYQSINLGLNF